MTWVNVDFSRELEKALKTDDLSELNRRLEAGLDPNSVDTSTQWSLLALAAKAGSRRVVEELLARGAIPEIGETSALVAAIETDQSAIVKRLLDAGASIGAGVTYHDEVFLPVVAAPHYAGLDVMRQVYAAEGIGRVEMVWWEDALKAALKRRGIGHLRIVAEALAPRLEVEGARELEATTLKATAKKLRAAARRQKDECERENLATLADALREAVDREKLELEETYDLLSEESWEVLRHRLTATPKERWRKVAGLQLVLAIRLEKAAYAAELIDRDPDPNVQDQSGIFALMHAARRGDLNMVRRLLALGADPLARETEKPFDSVIDWARYGANPDVIDLLSGLLGLDEAADAELDKLDGDELHREVNRLAALAAFERRWHRVEVLLDRGAEIDARAEDGKTLLVHAILRGDQERVRWLVRQGADLDAMCAQGRTIDSYARQSDASRPQRVSVTGHEEPETLMAELINELRSSS
jgi:uncharacterized protein